MEYDDLILDTTPLWEFLKVRFQEEIACLWLGVLPEPLRLALCDLIVRHRRRIRTTSGVVAEIQRLVQRVSPDPPYSRSRPRFHAQLWGLARRQFRDLEIEEHNAPLLELNPDILTHIGPVDAGLVAAAKRLVGARRRVLLVTSDRTLRNWCAHEDVPASFVEDSVRSPGESLS